MKAITDIVDGKTRCIVNEIDCGMVLTSIVSQQDRHNLRYYNCSSIQVNSAHLTLICWNPEPTVDGYPRYVNYCNVHPEDELAWDLTQSSVGIFSGYTAGGADVLNSISLIFFKGVFLEVHRHRIFHVSKAAQKNRDGVFCDDYIKQLDKHTADIEIFEFIYRPEFRDKESTAAFLVKAYGVMFDDEAPKSKALLGNIEDRKMGKFILTRSILGTYLNLVQIDTRYISPRNSAEENKVGANDIVRKLWSPADSAEAPSIAQYRILTALCFMVHMRRHIFNIITGKLFGNLIARSIKDYDMYDPETFDAFVRKYPNILATDANSIAL